jgi:hypothetical protein
MQGSRIDATALHAIELPRCVVHAAFKRRDAIAPTLREKVGRLVCGTLATR